MEIAGKSFLVTGGAGFIGSHIVDQLLQAGAARVVVLDNMTRGLDRNLDQARKLAGASADRLRLVLGDVRFPHDVREAVRGCDGVFHQAAIRITKCAAANREAVECLIMGTFNILEAAVEQGVRKVCSASSASVYGMADFFPTKESHHPYNNTTLYGACKAADEMIHRAFFNMHRLEYICLRPFNVYGPRMDIHGRYTEVLIRWMDRIDAGERPIIHGTGNQTMDFVYGEDVARAYMLAMQSDLTDRVYNVGFGEELSLKRLLELLLEAMGRPEMHPDHQPERQVNPVPRRLADLEGIRRDLEWEPRIEIQEGLRRLLAWRSGLLSRGERLG